MEVDGPQEVAAEVDVVGGPEQLSADEVDAVGRLIVIVVGHSLVVCSARYKWKINKLFTIYYKQWTSECKWKNIIAY